MENKNTTLIHAGQTFEPTNAVAPGIHQTSTWVYDRPEQLADVATTQQHAQFYNRYASPNTRQCEVAIAELCGAEAAICSASGMSAVCQVLFAFLKAGDHVVAQNRLYPATQKILDTWLADLGIETTFVEQTDVASWEKAIRPNTRIIVIETPVNPTLQLTDVAAVVNLAQKHGIVTMADNTFASPSNQPIHSMGIDLEVHSATKFLGGHSDLGAGVIVGSAAHVAQIWKIHTLMGASLHAHEAWLLRRGLMTYSMRIAQHNRNAQAVAEWLEGSPAVERVYYPGLPSHPQHEWAKRQMTGGFGGMVVFELAGGRQAGFNLLQNIKLIQHATSLGGMHSLMIHPASTIAAPLNDAELAAAGISPGLVRFSVGCEDAADIIADLDQALALLNEKS